LENQINNTILVTGAVGFTAMGMGAVVKSLMIIGIDKGRGFGGGLMGGIETSKGLAWQMPPPYMSLVGGTCILIKLVFELDGLVITIRTTTTLCYNRNVTAKLIRKGTVSNSKEHHIRPFQEN